MELGFFASRCGMALVCRMGLHEPLFFQVMFLLLVELLGLLLGLPVCERLDNCRQIQLCDDRLNGYVQGQW
jgi:hypothetical protein